MPAEGAVADVDYAFLVEDAVDVLCRIPVSEAREDRVAESGDGGAGVRWRGVSGEEEVDCAEERVRASRGGTLELAASSVTGVDGNDDRQEPENDEHGGRQATGRKATAEAIGSAQGRLAANEWKTEGRESSSGAGAVGMGEGPLCSTVQRGAFEVRTSKRFAGAWVTVAVQVIGRGRRVGRA